MKNGLVEKVKNGMQLAALAGGLYVFTGCATDQNGNLMIGGPNELHIGENYSSVAEAQEAKRIAQRDDRLLAIGVGASASVNKNPAISYIGDKAVGYNLNNGGNVVSQNYVAKSEDNWFGKQRDGSYIHIYPSGHASGPNGQMLPQDYIKYKEKDGQWTLLPEIK